ncbi:SEC-C domain-containing protein [Pseudoalteromonas sp. K222D]|uniref:YecA family protein n=1 Tax=Pseudoalteromonas sp. K222D TaxID=2820756 RepID=UPI001AD74FFD|nr:SEC-C domain-containing protein [Pseudoalteromonas sp. K222D]MBO7926360.1 SEC-C domain-containing protein [Pseudoalteromonas sp. K222D]
MKLGRNDPCPCGSGKKHKHCCMNTASTKQHAQIFDDITQTLAMNPELSLDELNLVAEQTIAARNNQADSDFCGLCPTQISNWLYAPFNELTKVTFNTPADLSSSPVMSYLALIFTEAMQQGGSIKATAKGNLPAKLVKQASELLPNFAVSKYPTHISISEFAGSNEDKFNALHYTRTLADVAGIIYYKSGHFHIKKSAQKLYQTQGINAFYLPMLEAAIMQYNWRYFDSFTDSVDLRAFWLFMLWRLQKHTSVEQLIDEVITAFPALLSHAPASQYSSPSELLGRLIESRFINRFLEFWGFVSIDPKRRENANIQPLLTQTFQFAI